MFVFVLGNDSKGQKVKRKTYFGVYSGPVFLFLIFFSQEEESVKLVTNISTQ
jgi:hypothetical protein